MVSLIPCHAMPKTNLQAEEKSVESIEAYLMFLRFNVRSLFTLLQVLQPALEESHDGDDLPDSKKATSTNGSDRITAVTRRVLPALRHYSIWLVSRAAVLGEVKTRNSSLEVHIKEMWKTYADSLSLLTVVFPLDSLAVVEYLLEEDEATIGFKPFRDEDIAPKCDLYILSDGSLKPRMSDPAVERNHPNVEMLARVRDLLKDGMELTVFEGAPIILSEGHFAFVEEGLPMSSPVNGHHSRSPSMQDVKDINARLDMPSPPRIHNQFLAPTQGVPQAENTRRAQSTYQSDAQSVDTSTHHRFDREMHLMVDNLLDGALEDTSQPQAAPGNDSNETSYGMHDSTADAFMDGFRSPSTDDRHTCQQRTTPAKPRRALPSISNSPFTPQPHELPLFDGSSTGYPSNLRATGTPSFAPPGFPHSSVYPSAVGHTTSPLPDQAAASDVNAVLQQHLSQRYSKAVSSSLSDLSNVYTSTPAGFGARAAPDGLFGQAVHNTTRRTGYGGTNAFDTDMLLQSSVYESTKRASGLAVGPTPPSGQGG